MARLSQELFRKWNDGETINAATYVQERELLRVAINGNDEQLRTKEDKATSLKIHLSPEPPENPDSYTYWYRDFGSGANLGGILIIANASTDGNEPVWFKSI